MLDLLRIKNLALIEDLEMEFSHGLNVLTGETGAGKSFIMKALSFVTGEKLAVDLVRPGSDRAMVEALFVHKGQDLIIRRELFSDSGRSRLYINDQLSSLEAAAELRPLLITHTSQHGQQKLLQPSYQAAMLDDFMAEPELLAEKDNILNSLNELAKSLNELEKKLERLAEKREILEFQQQEIEKLNPRENEEEELEKERTLFRGQADLSKNTEEALGILYGDSEGAGLFDRFAAFEKTLFHLASQDLEDFENSLDLVQAASSDLRDMAANIRKISDKSRVNIDIDKIESRLYALAQLKRKLKRSMPAILVLRDEIEENLTFLDNGELERRELIKDEEKICLKLASCLEKLNKAREAAAQTFCEALIEELKKLGFSEQLDLDFVFTPLSLYKGREDCIEQRARLLWMPNPGQAAQALDKIASGGELSRFLLAAVTVMSQKSSEDPTLIFDEVDAGVGGLTLNSVGKSLEELATNHQLLLITHWPQLAVKANNHFYIQKTIHEEQTYTSCQRLEGQDIRDELSRMAGGGEQGTAFASSFKSV